MYKHVTFAKTGRPISIKLVQFGGSTGMIQSNSPELPSSSPTVDKR